MRIFRCVSNEKGIAMVLAVSLIGLLSAFGVWMILDSKTALRITQALERHETVFNLAEGGLQLSLRSILESTPSPSFANLKSTTPTKITSGLPQYMSQTDLGKGTLTPSVDFIDYSTTPPPGWMLNWQGSTSFFSMYYKPRGDGSIPLPAAAGNARRVTTAFTLKVSR